jgi:hypothetical protein
VVTEAVGDGVRAQAHGILAADPVFSTLSEARRQVAAEAMIRAQAGAYTALMLVLGKGKRDDKVFAAFLDRIEKRFAREFGIPLGKLALTQGAGFVELSR